VPILLRIIGILVGPAFEAGPFFPTVDANATGEAVAMAC